MRVELERGKECRWVFFWVGGSIPEATLEIAKRQYQEVKQAMGQLAVTLRLVLYTDRASYSNLEGPLRGVFGTALIVRLDRSWLKGRAHQAHYDALYAQKAWGALRDISLPFILQDALLGKETSPAQRWVVFSEFDVERLDSVFRVIECAEPFVMKMLGCLADDERMYSEPSLIMMAENPASRRFLSIVAQAFNAISAKPEIHQAIMPKLSEVGKTIAIPQMGVHVSVRKHVLMGLYGATWGNELMRLALYWDELLACQCDAERAIYLQNVEQAHPQAWEHPVPDHTEPVTTLAQQQIESLRQTFAQQFNLSAFAVKRALTKDPEFKRGVHVLLQRMCDHLQLRKGGWYAKPLSCLLGLMPSVVAKKMKPHLPHPLRQSLAKKQYAQMLRRALCVKKKTYHSLAALLIRFHWALGIDFDQPSVSGLSAKALASEATHRPMCALMQTIEAWQEYAQKNLSQ